jgi:hypothetical protein
MFPTTFPTQENIISPSDSPRTSSDFWDSLGHCGKAPTHLQETAIAMREFLMEHREKTISGEAVL